MKKYRPKLNDFEIKELQRLSKLDFSNYTEADVREEFLVELLKLLGYRKDLDYSVSREETFKLNPLFLSVGSKRIKLDYICSLRKQYFWIIDAKEGRCSNKNSPPSIDEQSISQTHFYSLHREINCRYFIVSNGWYTNLYDRDNLDEQLTPILSIRNSELFERFLELDSYVGSTQLLPKVKESILDQIEKVFSAEVRVERLDEFIDAVKDKAGKLRAKVERAAFESYQKNVRNEGGFIALKTEDVSKSVYSIFQNLRARFEFEAATTLLINRIKENRLSYNFEEYSFFSKLMLEKPYPVNFWYYPSVLHFLFRAHKEGVGTIYFRQQKIEDLLREWIDLCLFHLSKRKVLRYLWACERIHAKVVKQTFVLFPTFRDKITSVLDQKLFYVPEEALGYLGPDQASIIINVVESSISFYRSQFLKKYSDDYGIRFKEQLALQEFKTLVQLSKQIDADFGESYEKIKKELGEGWQDLMWYEYVNFDRMGNVIFDILKWNRESLYLLSENQKRRIKLIAELGCTNFADEVCEILGIDYNKNISSSVKEQATEKFFDPAIDQYSFTI